jgi:hypothetical protein
VIGDDAATADRKTPFGSKKRPPSCITPAHRRIHARLIPEIGERDRFTGGPGQSRHRNRESPAIVQVAATTDCQLLPMGTIRPQGLENK